MRSGRNGGSTSGAGRSSGRVQRCVGNDVLVSSIGISARHAHVERDAYDPDMQKAWKGRRGAKWVRKLGGGEEDKGGDLLPKLLLTPLLPALRLSAPSLLWALWADHPRVVGEEPEVEGQRWRASESGYGETGGGSHSQQPVIRRALGGVRGCDLQTQWSERFRLETMRTFPAALEMGIAQHTTRGEDRPLLSPIVGRVEKGFWGRGLGKREWGGG